MPSELEAWISLYHLSLKTGSKLLDFHFDSLFFQTYPLEIRRQLTYFTSYGILSPTPFTLPAFTMTSHGSVPKEMIWNSLSSCRIGIVIIQSTNNNRILRFPDSDHTKCFVLADCQETDGHIGLLQKQIQAFFQSSCTIFNSSKDLKFLVLRNAPREKECLYFGDLQRLTGDRSPL